MAIISEFAHHQIWPLWVLMFLISPLPGFLNCLVYVRPRVLSWKEDRQKQRAKKNKETMTHTSATNPQDSSIGMRRDEEPDVDNVSKNKDGVAANDDANVASDETECPRIDQNTMAEALI